jgi:hypothetical protein
MVGRAILRRCIVILRGRHTEEHLDPL